MWEQALDVARTLMPDEAWRLALARALHDALGEQVCFASVITCVPGNWLHLRWSSWPDRFDQTIRVIVSNFLWQMDRSEPWDSLLERLGPVLAPLDQAKDRRLSKEMWEQVLRPHDLDGFVVGYCLDDSKALVGILCLSSADPSEELLARVREPFGAVAAAAGETLSQALALAKGCGAIFPPRVRGLQGLTPREEQVLQLLLDGLSDGRIGNALGIKEDTVGVHVGRIFRKFDVRSRAELGATLQGRPKK